MNATREIVKTPPLANGERMSRETFHERYVRMPPNTRAELIDGIVHMPSPTSYDHGDGNTLPTVWLDYYAEFTPGVAVSVNATVILDDLAELQPDLSLRILPEFGGRVRHDGGFILGAPELVLEVSRSSLALDLGPKKAEYERSGVIEYIVADIDQRRIHWFAQRRNGFHDLEPDADGVLRSQTFPGLWLDAAAYFSNDRNGLRRLVDRGVATLEHAEFVRRLSESRD